MVPGDHKMTAGGLLMPTYTKHLCRWCGAAFEKEDGCEHHEMQCREQIRVRLLSAALGNPVLAERGATALVELVEGVCEVVSSLPRKTWDEIRA